jgi:hypothetical protein
MHLKLKRIAPLQAGKMLAAFYGLLSLIFVPFMLFFMAMGSFAARQHGGSSAPALPLMFGMGLGFMVLLPFLYAAMGFILGVIGAAIYNLLTKWIGGFEFEFEAKEPPVFAAL